MRYIFEDHNNDPREQLKKIPSYRYELVFPHYQVNNYGLRIEELIYELFDLLQLEHTRPINYKLQWVFNPIYLNNNMKIIEILKNDGMNQEAERLKQFIKAYNNISNISTPDEWKNFLQPFVVNQAWRTYNTESNILQIFGVSKNLMLYDHNLQNELIYLRASLRSFSLNYSIKSITNGIMLLMNVNPVMYISEEVMYNKIYTFVNAFKYHNFDYVIQRPKYIIYTLQPDVSLFRQLLQCLSHNLNYDFYEYFQNNPNFSGTTMVSYSNPITGDLNMAII